MPFRSASTNTGGIGSYSLVLSAPAGVANTDVLIAWWTNGSGIGQVTFPPGFVIVSNASSLQADGAHTFVVAKKNASNSEPSTYTISSTVGDYATAGIAAFSSNGYAFPAVATTITPSNRSSPFSLSSSGVNIQTYPSDVIWICHPQTGFGFTSAPIFTVPTGFTQRANCNAANYQSSSIASIDNYLGNTGTLNGSITVPGGTSGKLGFSTVVLGLTPILNRLSNTGTFYVNGELNEVLNVSTGPVERSNSLGYFTKGILDEVTNAGTTPQKRIDISGNCFISGIFDEVTGAT